MINRLCICRWCALRPVKHRGLCATCYQRARYCKMLDLIALPPRKAGRPKKASNT